MTGNDAVEIKFLMEQIANSQSLMSEIERQEKMVSYLSSKQDSWESWTHIKWWVVLLNGFLVTPIIASPFVVISFNFALVIWLVLWAASIVVIPLLCKKKVNSLQVQIDKECETLANMKNDSTLNWLPFNYRDSFSYKYIAQYIHNGRAYNLKEAINLLETEQHQARMELLAAMGRLSQ